MDQTPDTTLQQLWRFIRGDMQASDFEHWVHGEAALEAQLGDELHLETISTDFADQSQVWSLRSALARHARSRAGPSCLCARLRDVEVVDMGFYRAPAPAFEADREWSGDGVFESLDEVKDRGGRYWWLYAARCSECAQGWLVGCEARINDVMCMRRLDAGELEAIEQEDRWPAEFESFECLLEMGHRAGRSVRWVDDIDADHGATIAQIATEKPGITVREIAVLLSIDVSIAERLARRAVNERKVRITFDSA